MTILGTDISSYQSGLDLSKLQHSSFVFAKTTEGTYYTDPDYEGWRVQARNLGIPFVWYHYLSTENPSAQVAHTLQHVTDTRLPGMIDVEKMGITSVDFIGAYVLQARLSGLNPRLLYLPHWFWQNDMGSPDLTPLARQGLYLISSAYPSTRRDTPWNLYPGDNASGWNSYGNMTPKFYQFTSQALDAGQFLDYNAFKGTLADFNQLLTGVPNMALIPPSIAQKWSFLTSEFPPNSDFDNETALIWADGGARAAAWFGEQIYALLKTGVPIPTTVQISDADVDRIAAAVIQRLGKDTVNG